MAHDFGLERFGVLAERGGRADRRDVPGRHVGDLYGARAEPLGDRAAQEVPLGLQACERLAGRA
ncbi:MAG: hypothetical protein JRE70_21560 [Deltaproteobacteria bacterium]|nr:hypothetical protein [Deltaproteobacteria bacterium]